MKLAVLIIVSALLLALVTPTAAGPQIITIGVSLSQTGRYAEMGQMQAKGFSLWEQHVNQTGGLLGKQVRLRIYNDQSDPETAAGIYRRLIEVEKVDLVFGPYSSGISEAVLPVAEKNGYPLLLSGASADRLWEQGYRYAFGVYTPASKYAVGFLEMLVKSGFNNLAIVSADDAFSLSISKGTRGWTQKFKLDVVLFERFEKKRTDLSDIALRVKASRAQALIVCGHLDEAVSMRRALKKISWYPAAYYASVGPATDAFHDLLGEDANGVFSSSQWEEQAGAAFPKGKEFIAAFKRRFGESPTYHAATAYAAGMILQEALQKVGRLDRTALRETLATLDTMTLIGRYGVDQTGWQIRHFPLIIQWQNHQRKVVWPQSVSASSPAFGPME